MYVEREIAGSFDSAAKINSVVVIVGPRQGGKTTFLQEHPKSGGVYLTFDDPDVKELFDLDIKRFENQYMKTDRITILDEIQYGKDPGRKLKYLADKGKKLWVTSSSQTALGKDVISWLVGRAAIIKLYPFSIKEFMDSKGQQEITGNVLARDIDEHLRYGGYPKVVMESDIENKKLLLRNLYETMVLKDVARMFNIDDIDAIEKLSRYLSHMTGKLLVYENVCRDLGMSFQSVKKYISAMEKSYLINLVPPFYKNRLKEITKQHKIYFVDTGMRNATANEFGVDPEENGGVFENYVVSELVKAGYAPNYWQSKSKAEVDVIVRKGNEAIPIEVKLSAGSEIERSMRSFIGTYRPKRGFIVFKNGEKGERRIDACTINFVNVKDLLSKLGGA